MKNKNEVSGGKCPECGTRAEMMRCDECGDSAWVINCGHMSQPRPFASGRSDGTDSHLIFCAECAECAGKGGRMKHTPGPWQVDRRPYSYTILSRWTSVDPGDQREVCRIADYDAEHVTEQQAIDAALIAAAPDLLEALQDMVQYMSGLSHVVASRAGSKKLLLASAVIARAEGGGR